MRTSSSSRTGSVREARGIAFRARHLNQFAHQHVQPVRFALDAIERHVGVAAAPRQFHRHAQARQRRPQLVRNILQQPALRFEQTFDPLRHLIDGAAELAQFIARAASSRAP